MKIVAVLEQDVFSGGGFNQSLNAILQMQCICAYRFEFAIATTIESNLAELDKLGISACLVKITWFDRILAAISSNPFWLWIQERFQLVGKLEKQFMRLGTDIVYFLSPSPRALAMQKLVYIITVWDLCHRDAVEFPEVRIFGEFQRREYFYRNALPGAAIILADSETLARKIAFRYGVDDERIIPMPFAPAVGLDKLSNADLCKVMRKYQLETGYFFYPAQFWPHKNHARIIESLLYLRDNDFPAVKIVFVGSDKGHQSKIVSMVKDAGLDEYVRFLGFVPHEDMAGLYQGARAVIMPSYFGPTNIPPLEAWKQGVPLIYSSYFHEQVNNAGLLVDPDGAFSLAEAIKQCFNHEVIEQLIKNGYERLRSIDEERLQAEHVLLEALSKLEKRQHC
jgi:glycosyltransferase involved in cell wall biosynthesis